MRASRAAQKSLPVRCRADMACAGGGGNQDSWCNQLDGGPFEREEGGEGGSMLEKRDVLRETEAGAM